MYSLAQSDSPQALSRARGALPRCYSRELDACLNKDNQNGLPEAECNAILAAYDADWDQAEAYVTALPFCSQKPDTALLLMVGAGGVLVGFVLSTLLRRTA